MILFIDKERFPSKEGTIKEENIYDKNGFKWKISRGEDGYLYFGFFDENVYFTQKHLFISLEKSDLKIENPLYFAVNDYNYDTYIIFKDLIEKHYTDGVWEKIGEIMSKINY